MGAATNSLSTAADINRIASFLAHEQIADLSKTEPVDCIVLCVSAILHCAETVFSALEKQPDLAKTLVICGGIGHSTQYLYDSIARNAKYQHLRQEVQGLPESRVLEKILNRHFDVAKITSNGSGCQIMVEDKSTNCGANAIETRKLLESHRITIPKTFIIVQDPTMALRTVASFQKAYSDMADPPHFASCPSFAPKVHAAADDAITTGGTVLSYANTDVVDPDGLWDMTRFCDLILGEIPRLRDDANGYGPAGKGFIAHVDIPHDVEEAWTRLGGVLASATTGRSKVVVAAN